MKSGWLALRRITASPLALKSVRICVLVPSRFLLTPLKLIRRQSGGLVLMMMS